MMEVIFKVKTNLNRFISEIGGLQISTEASWSWLKIIWGVEDFPGCQKIMVIHINYYYTTSQDLQVNANCQKTRVISWFYLTQGLILKVTTNYQMIMVKVLNNYGKS
jgi:hypothetical protein